LADIAMEIYAAESTALRVTKLAGQGTDDERAFRDGLAALVLDRSVGRIRAEARAVLAELHDGEALAERLRGLEAVLPVPVPLVRIRNRVSDRVVASEGVLPGDVA
jgi:hypothetical protein